MASNEPLPRVDDRPPGGLAAEMGWGLLASLGIHTTVLLMILLGAIWGTPIPLEHPKILTVNLVRLAAKTMVSAGAKGMPIDNKATDMAALLPEPPKTPVSPKAAAEPGITEAGRVPPPKIGFAPPMISTLMAPPPTPRFEPRPRPSENDRLAARLKMFARLHDVATHNQLEDPGLNGTGRSDAVGNGRQQNELSALKDIIRAQVERRWNLDRREIGAHDWTVGIHILLSPNGRVRSAGIVSDVRYASDSIYLDFARSARNAVLVSSPLILPPGTYAVAHDIVVDFDSRDAAR